MAVMGIESSAHTFGVGIIENGRVLANCSARYVLKSSGIVPAKVADFHAQNASAVINDALEKADIHMSDIRAIGYTRGPGLGPCLRVGQLAAAALAARHKCAILPVNHALAHVEIARELARFRAPIALYVSGGNSQIISLENMPYKHYKVYGETLDIGIGNMLDNFARGLKLVPAWGTSVERLASNGSYVALPYTVKGMDFTFTGLLTHSLEMISQNRATKADIAFSLQQTGFSMLCEALERAMMLTSKRELIVCGGVAQNNTLQNMLNELCRSHGSKFYVAPNEYNADNGAMIALVAEKMLDSMPKKHGPMKCGITQRWRIDSVRITW